MLIFRRKAVLPMFIHFVIIYNHFLLFQSIIEHPSFIAGEDVLKRTDRTGNKDPFFRMEEKSQFSPDITPLILSAHYNNHEIIQVNKIY